MLNFLIAGILHLIRTVVSLTGNREPRLAYIS